MRTSDGAKTIRISKSIRLTEAEYNHCQCKDNHNNASSYIRALIAKDMEEQVSNYEILKKLEEIQEIIKTSSIVQEVSTVNLNSDNDTKKAKILKSISNWN